MCKTTSKYIQLQGNCGRKCQIYHSSKRVHQNTHTHTHTHTHTCKICVNVLQEIGGIKDIIRRRQWHPTPVLLPGGSHGWRSLVGCTPWGHWESDTTEQFHFNFSLSCIGEGNGNPLQCSCLEKPRDGGAWWAAIYGVAQSRTWLKRLSSSKILFGKTATASKLRTITKMKTTKPK